MNNYQAESNLKDFINWTKFMLKEVKVIRYIHITLAPSPICSLSQDSLFTSVSLTPSGAQLSGTKFPFWAQLQKLREKAKDNSYSYTSLRDFAYVLV